MFQEGDSVYIKDSACEDIQALAWKYIETHRDAAIVCGFKNHSHEIPERESLYVVVWPEPFEGGWDCWQNCMPGYGQIVTQKHMDLNFEASRTVPDLGTLNYGEHL